MYFFVLKKLYFNVIINMVFIFSEQSLTDGF